MKEGVRTAGIKVLTKNVFGYCCVFRYQSQPVPLVSVEEVNQWVENATNGHITNFLENIHHDVVVMLMNAMYFKGETFRQRLLSMPTSTVVIVKKKSVFYLLD